MRKKNKKPLRRKIVLRLPDLDHSKNAVLNSLSSATTVLDASSHPRWGICGKP